MLRPLFKKIETAFENEYIQENFSFLNELPDFSVEDRSELMMNLSYYSEQYQNENSWSILFSQLSAFFEWGIMFHKSPAENTKAINNIQHIFYRGGVHNCKSVKMSIRFPNSELFTIYRTPTVPLLKKLKLDFVPNQNKHTCFIVRVSETTTFILFSEKADPWLKLLIENLQKTLITFSCSHETINQPCSHETINQPRSHEAINQSCAPEAANPSSSHKTTNQPYSYTTTNPLRSYK